MEERCDPTGTWIVLGRFVRAEIPAGNIYLSGAILTVSDTIVKRTSIMSKASSAPSKDSPTVAEATPVNYKKIALILLAAVVFGLGIGVAGTLALKKYARPPAGATAELAPAVVVPAPTAAPASAPILAPAPATELSAAAEAAPAPALAPAGVVPSTAAAQTTVSIVSGDSTSIPVLTGAEIKERYNISRFVDVETDRLCYLAEPRASGMNGSLTCEQRPSHVSRKRGG